MSNLSTSEQYQDRLEIIGYGTSIISGCLFLVYFTMLFFSKSVQAHMIGSKLTILLLSLITLITGFFIPLYKNTARLILRCCFLLIASFSFFEFFDKASWYFGLLFCYTFYGYWVLSHPMAIHFFRPLKKREEPLTKKSGLYMAHLTLLNIMVLIFFLKFWVQLIQETHTSDFSAGLGYLFLTLFLSWLLWGLRRLKNLARWFLIITAGIAFFTFLPGSFGLHSQNVLELLKAIAYTGYFLFLTLFMLFSPSVKRLYTTTQKQPS